MRDGERRSRCEEVREYKIDWTGRRGINVLVLALRHKQVPTS